MSATAGISAKVDRYRVLIVDDHPIVRQGLARFISQEPDIEVCGGADNVSDAMNEVRALQPHLVVVDISLKDSQGIDLIAQIKAYDQQIRTLVWSTFDEKVFAERALRAGAMGYLNKQESVENVLLAIRQVLQGDMYLSPQMTNYVLRRVAGNGPLQQDPIAGLSNREVEVFRMVGEGMTTQQIAGKLGVRPKTVEAHREGIKSKLNLRNAAELNRRAVQWVLENS